MAEPQKSQEPGDGDVRFSSDCELLVVREEDTTPGKVSEKYRKWLEDKYGRKVPPDKAGG